MSTTKDCAARIKALTKLNKISINKLLTDCGLTKSLIYDMEARNSMPSADKLSRISDYFHVTTDYLLTGEEPKKLSPSADNTEEDNEINLHDINFALSGEVHDLTEEEKEDLVAVVRLMRQRRKERELRKQKEQQKDG